MRIAKMALFVGGITLVAACAEKSAPVGPMESSDAPTVLALSPANATTGVDPTKPVVITFSVAMMPGMEMLVVMHAGSLSGPLVSGVASWSTDRTTLTFMPSVPLQAHSTYVLHLSPSLRSTAGQPINLAGCARLGGQYVTQGMMGITSGGGMMNGAWGPGMMGAGWQGVNGNYGMIFAFTTA